MKDELYITFSTPLAINVHHVAPPTRTVVGRFTQRIHDVTITGENMSETLPIGHYGTVTVEWVDEQSNPAPVDGPTSWASTDSTVLTVTVSTGNPLIANCQAIAIGSAQIQATADADMGEGVKSITSTLDVTVIKGEAVGGKMSFTDQGSGPPPSK